MAVTNGETQMRHMKSSHMVDFSNVDVILKREKKVHGISNSKSVKMSTQTFLEWSGKIYQAVLCSSITTSVMYTVGGEEDSTHQELIVDSG